MHKFYVIANVGGKDYLVKLTVDELNSSDKPIRRAYNVNGIKIAPIAGSQVYKPAFTMDAAGESISNISISNLFEIVKEYDNEFNPKSVNHTFLIPMAHLRYFITERKPSLLFLTAASVQRK